MLNKLTNWYFSRRALPYWCVLTLDCALVMLSGYIGMYLDMRGYDLAMNFWEVTWGLVLSLIPFATMFHVFHTYTGIVRYSTFIDLMRVMMAMLTACLINAIIYLALDGMGASYAQFPSILALCIIFFLGTMLLSLVRVIVKALFDTTLSGKNVPGAFIYGVKGGGIALAKGLRNSFPKRFELKGFVSPDGDIETKYLLGVSVRRDGPNLLKHMKDAGAEVMIVSPLQIDHFRERDELISALIDNGIKVMIHTGEQEWDGKSDLHQSLLRAVEIEDLLPREKIEVDMNAIGKMLSGKRILVTGAAGSIGSEIVRQVAKFHPSELILIDQAETPMHDVRRFLQRYNPELKAETIVGDISNQTHMESIFAHHRPEYVFHAAAYKHVPMMEDNPAMAVQNNVYGTRVIADLAVKYGTKKFVMISTDKAVNPTNVMGCSKRICEIYCQSLNTHLRNENSLPKGEGRGGAPSCQFVTTRFGNVLGSNGSVIPIFKEQIMKGGPVTVTHPDIIRYFMLIPEACQLVLEAGTMGKGGEIFVFDMGSPVRIVDLAKRMINLSGAKNIEIKFTGLRDGEKLYEEVLADEEGTMPTVHPKIMVAKVREYPYAAALKNEKELYDLSFTYDDMAIVKKMKEIVPEYKSKQSKYKVLD